MKQHKRKSYRSYLSLLVCSYLTVCGGGTTVSFAADMSETQEAQSAQESASATAPIKLSDSYVRPDYVEIEKLRDTKQIIVITKKMIEEKGYKTISDVLKDQPSINVGATFWGEIDIRGQGGDQAHRNIQVLIDGAPMTTMVTHPLPNNYDYVPVEQIEKIEIIPGGGSVIYGSGAAGGIINITTNLRSMNKPQRTVTTEWNSDGYRLGFNYGDKVGEKLTVQGGYNKLERDLYFKNTYRDSDYLFAGLRYDADSDHSVTFRFSHLEEQSRFVQNISRSMVERYGRNARPSDGKYNDGDRDLNTYNLTYNQNLGGGWKFSGDVFYADGNYRNSKIVNGRMYHDSYGTRMKFDYAYGKRDSLLIGLDWLNQSSHLDYISGRKLMSFNYEKETRALYLLNQMRRGKFTFTQGVRREDLIWSFDKDGGTLRRPIGGKADSHRWNTAGELSAAYQYGSIGRVFVRYERGFTSPDGLQIADEVYSGPSGKVYQATTAQEEHYNLYEIGVRDKIGATSVNLTLFAAMTNNELNRPYFIGAYGPEYKTFNMFNVRRRGVELTLQQRLGKLDLMEGYTYLHGRRTYTEQGRAILDEYGEDAIDFTNSGLVAVPKHKAIIQVNYTFDKKWSVGAKYTYFGSYNNFVKESKRNEMGSVIESYGLLDVNFKFKQNEDLEWYGGVTNVLNKTYYEYASEGLWTLTPGFPRTYFVGARYSF